MFEDFYEPNHTEPTEDHDEDPWERLDQALEQIETLHESPAESSPMFDQLALLLAES